MNTNPLVLIALAISHFEGHTGDLNMRNNNPGNLVFADQANATKDPTSIFAKFDTFEHGFDALMRQILLDATRNPLWSLRQFVDSYAPPSAGNPNNANYAAAIAAALCCKTTDTLQTALHLNLP